MAIRLGFIGTGGIAQGHMERLTGLEGVEAAGHFDVQADRAEASAAKWGGRAYPSVQAMVDEAKLDGAVICTPPFAHGEAVEGPVCEAGLPFLIEKPIAVDIATARQVEAWVKAKDLATVVAYKYRWDDHVMKAREMLADKTIGLVHGDFWGGLPGVAWWRVMAESGGQLVEQTTHIVDMARYLCGEIESVQALYALRALQDVENLDIPDVGTVNVTFASGALGNISNTCILEGWGRSSLRVMAKGFTLEIAWNRLTCASAAGTEEIEQTADGYLGEDVAFIEAIKGDRSLIHSDYSEGLKTLAVTLAANLSAQDDGRLVKISEVG
ncbi:MAG: Gfo/Idh/MocA family oxidoreductase [Armatimonadetes bacterium]|nr:Gfo/Idh/MocA family oxidoreductase [Armatimonadota bacterium]